MMFALRGEQGLPKRQTLTLVVRDMESIYTAYLSQMLTRVKKIQKKLADIMAPKASVTRLLAARTRRADALQSDISGYLTG